MEADRLKALKLAEKKKKAAVDKEKKEHDKKENKKKNLKRPETKAKNLTKEDFLINGKMIRKKVDSEYNLRCLN